MRIQHLFLAWALSLTMATAQNYIQAPPEGKTADVPPQEWLQKIEKLAPAKATVKPAAPRKVLLFSLTTGFQHQVRVYVSEVIKTIGRKTGAFTVTETSDIECFAKDNLAKYDALICNNNCPDGKKRDIFYDVLNNQVNKAVADIGLKYKDLTEQQRQQKGAELEKNIMEYVASGKGLMSIHGAIALQINSPAFSEMMGGSFDFHPPRQVLTLELVDPKHPLVAGFQGKGYMHSDELYTFKNAYEKHNFHPLLEVNRAKLDEKKLKDPKTVAKVDAKGRLFVSWIKPYGKGRVFFVSPSHQPESYETEAMLRYYADGIQYVLGDLKCDDSPMK